MPTETLTPEVNGPTPTMSADALPSLVPTTVSLPTETSTLEVEDGLDLTRLPIGDGRLSDEPESGAIWLCNQQFPDRNVHIGPWINDDGTFDYTSKVVVEGMVLWDGNLEITLEGNLRVIAGNGLPDHPTGRFPADRLSEAYQIDPNRNSILSQVLKIELLAIPTQANRTSCLRLGVVGVMLTGGTFFNALDAIGLDAVAHEVRDACDGHPQGAGIYHYHSLTPCIEDVGSGHSGLVGYAFDGFGIYGFRGEGGKLLTNTDLDECHGHAHPVMWDGIEIALYHYHASREYPYTLGCYRGTPIRGLVTPG